MQQAIIWTNDNPIHWRIYVALGGDELNRSTYHNRKRIFLVNVNI